MKKVKLNRWMIKNIKARLMQKQFLFEEKISMRNFCQISKSICCTVVSPSQVCLANYRPSLRSTGLISPENLKIKTTMTRDFYPCQRFSRP